MSETILSFKDVLTKFRNEAFSERDKGYKFEKLMKAYLEIAPEYNGKFKEVWLWEDFPYRRDFSGKDTGIDLVALTVEGDYWAIQCKCYAKDARITKDGVDSFLATSSKEFYNDKMQKTRFAYRLWISTTNNWNGEAEKTIQNQNPPVLRIGLSDLEAALIDWDKLVNGNKDALLAKYPLREHQKTAVDSAHEYFQTSDRGKLIMACGTGKTFTSLKIAENETNSNGLVLFLVPSIALLGQTLREWSAQSELPIHPICICSDSKATQDRESDGSVVDLALPASTDVKSISRQYFAAMKAQEKNGGMIVVFSTYQSIDVISQAQAQINKQNEGSCIFDLIICDEAHRTTGVILSDKAESFFTKVHDNAWIQAKKRLYMTATPRLYTDASKQKAQEGNAILCSMDDPVIYGEEIYRIGFGEAVKRDLLSDYKVLILTIKEDQIPVALQNVIKDKNNEIDTDDISKLIGCINALSKRVLETDEAFNDDKQLMHTAVAFCQNINISKKIANMFNQHKDAYYDSLTQDERAKLVGVYADHIDGSMGASVRAEKLSWLKDVSQDSKDCHILCNVKCLSEGVDVPSLDAVMFLSAKNSQVDVVQSVGRVMRKSRTTDKKYGYIIIPIVIPADVAPEEALDDNERYKVVWSVLNALRSHDDRFDAEINQIDLNKKKGRRIIIGGGSGNPNPSGDDDAEQLNLPYLEKLQDAMYAKMVKKVGNRMYWVQWAQDVAHIAERYIERINRLIAQEGKHKKAFEALLKGLRKNINPSITPDAVVQMLAQHLITQPVFEALFENYSFVANNPVSKSLQKMVALLEEQSFDKDTEFLNKFYDSVKERVKGIDNAEGKQKVIVELYDKFFKTAFPKVVEQLGIVYTPVEVVDFINHSVAKVLKKEFNRNLSDENVHILDPFTGTGTFITRLIQTGLIDKEALPRKYAKELHANEIVLLAYYIASINIENAYHDAVGMENGYKSFNGICLTDTFQLGESDNADELFSDMLPQNSERVMEQKKLPVRVIIGNPPYSAKQKSANDNAQNQKYPKLDAKIEDTYAKLGSAINKNALYDPYIKAFRWSSDRIDNEHGGIIAFITNSGWIDSNSMDGFRKCIEQEFNSIYVFNLRGAIRGKSKDAAQKEGQNVFDIMTGVAITILVKNPKQHTGKATIYYHDIGDYLKRSDKLELLNKYESINNNKIEWKVLKTNEHGDWLSQRSDLFSSFIPIGDKTNKTNTKTIFLPYYSNGTKTNRDVWVFNYKKSNVVNNVKQTISFYNKQMKEYQESDRSVPVEDFIDNNPQKISWSRCFRDWVSKGKELKYDDNCYVVSQYRPYVKQFLYFSRELINDVALLPSLFPKESHNLVICIPGLSAKKDYSCFITNIVPDLNIMEAGAQCFPLYYYDKNEGNIGTLFDNGNENYVRRDGITDFIFEQCRERYGHKVMKEDIFYYVYGLLHSKDYREQFAADLKKMLPHIPLVEKPADFWAFSKAGRELAELHLNYETVPAYPDVKVIGAESGKFRVEKLTFGKNGKDVDKSVLVYNSYIRIENIPLEAYDYVVNGKSAIEWIMDRYQVKTDKDSGITNDPNDWGLEHNNPRYILDLILSIITVSIATNEIVKNLPKLDLK